MVLSSVFDMTEPVSTRLGIIGSNNFHHHTSEYILAVWPIATKVLPKVVKHSDVSHDLCR